jgi:hypothetical protein
MNKEIKLFANIESDKVTLTGKTKLIVSSNSKLPITAMASDVFGKPYEKSFIGRHVFVIGNLCVVSFSSAVKTDICYEIE